MKENENWKINLNSIIGYLIVWVIQAKVFFLIYEKSLDWSAMVSEIKSFKKDVVKVWISKSV